MDSFQAYQRVRLSGSDILAEKSRSAAIRRWLVVLCLALVTIAATAQAVHFHPETVGAANHCSICVVMHSAPVAAHHVHLDFSFQTSRYFHVGAKSARISSLASFALFSRPPPLV